MAKYNGIFKVGDFKDRTSRRVRIVHISDTNMLHDDLQHFIPEGDILVHSGNFGNFSFLSHLKRSIDYRKEVEEINRFFSSLPHKHKIFVAGNHEIAFEYFSVNKTESVITEAIYLQDKFINIEGINFYGSPWSLQKPKKYARGFTAVKSKMWHHWGKIPKDTDVVVTHSPPEGVLDFFIDKEGDFHSDAGGCPFLKNAIFTQVRPKIHLFGHMPDANGAIEHDGIIFSNAAMKKYRRPTIIDYYISDVPHPSENMTYYYEKQV